jgi:hypothetical protein
VAHILEARAALGARAIRSWRLFVLLALLIVIPHSSVAGAARPTTSWGNLPLRFEANEGQSDPLVKFLARGRGYALFLQRPREQRPPDVHDHAGEHHRWRHAGPEHDHDRPDSR